jgi:hypothetical protein
MLSKPAPPRALRNLTTLRLHFGRRILAVFVSEESYSANPLCRLPDDDEGCPDASKTRLSVLANGALTSIPFGILIASDPQGKKLSGPANGRCGWGAVLTIMAAW